MFTFVICKMLPIGVFLVIAIAFLYGIFFPEKALEEWNEIFRE